MTAEADSSPGSQVTHGRRAGAPRALALLSAAAVVALAACSGGSGTSTSGGSSSAGGGTPQKGGTLNLLGVGDVDYMDPNLSYYTGGYMAHRLWSRQPYTYSGDKATAGKTVPDLATDMPKVSADGLKATITLREGVKWDTTPPRQITAEDLIRGIKRTCNPAQPFGGLPDYQDLIVGFQKFCDGFSKAGQTAAAISAYQNANQVEGLKVGADERTLEITMTHPAAYLADMMTLTAFTPAPKEYDAYVPGSAELGQHTISSGPYKITKYEPTKTLSLVRNPNWDPATDKVRGAYVDKVEVSMTGAQESIQQQLQTGTPSADMEWDTFPPPATVPGLLAANDPNLNLGETTSSNPYVIFNQVSPNNSGAMAKVEFRQALMYAINRDTIIQALGGPKTNPPLTKVLPSNMLGGEENYDLYPHDVAKAKDLLAKAGFPNGVTLKFLYRNQSQGSSKTFATIQQDLKAVGITVEGVPSPNADFYTKYLQVPSVAKKGVWDLSLAGWGADWSGNAALSYFKPLFSGEPSFPPIGSNYGFYNNPATNQLIDAAVNAKTEEEAKAAWGKADRAVMADAVIFPITNVRQANYHATQVKNAVYLDHLQNFDPANVWLDPAKNGG